MKQAFWIVALLVAAGLLLVQQRKIAAMRTEASALSQSLVEARSEAERAASANKIDPAEAKRIENERAELVKLRAEVAALRQQKIANDNRDRAAAEAAALAALAASESKANTTQAAQAMQWVETVLNSPANVRGAAAGAARRKLLSGEPITEAEKALLMNMNSKAAELENSPTDFAQFQTAMIGSLLGWTDDVRVGQVQNMIFAAANAAKERNLGFHDPAANANNWSEEQKALNGRATAAVQKMLSPEERQVFDRAFIGVLGVDTGARP